MAREIFRAGAVAATGIEVCKPVFEKSVDKVLICKVRAGDPEALMSVFDDFAPHVFAYLRRLGKDDTEADQMVGDVFAVLVEEVNKGKGPDGNLLGYLKRCAKNLLIDDFRLNGKFRGLEALSQINLGNRVNFTREIEKSVDDLEKEESCRKLKALLNECDLSEDQRYVIYLRFWAELKFNEIAEIIGKTTNNTKVIFHRAIKALGKNRNIKSLAEGVEFD